MRTVSPLIRGIAVNSARPADLLAGESGWFSDRSGCYLAAGRPVVMEDTGLGRHVPVGLGLLTYTDIDSAAACLDAVQRDYEKHARPRASSRGSILIPTACWDASLLSAFDA